jgi:multisubunit Na+/H+ antiporter MnhB subunit
VNAMWIGRHDPGPSDAGLAGREDYATHRVPERRQIHRTSIRVMSVLMILIGIALVVRTLAAGGGGLAVGLLLGILFVAAGAGRLYLQFRGP